MSLLKKRLVFAPFEYQEAYDYWLKQQQAHWLHTEVSMSSDINDWKLKLSDHEKNIIGSVLKGFTQTEVMVNDYWMNKVGTWFPKPEISMMASAFASMESIHAKAYAYLNESLGLDDFEAFLQEPTSLAKIENLIARPAKNKKDIARSLAVFSAFAEGVQLFSSFAILMSFSTRDMLKGVGQIVAFSVRDESLHSDAGCWMFRQLIKEHPEILDDQLKKDILEAARIAVKLEDDFIDMAFSGQYANGYINVFYNNEKIRITPHELKQYIRYRTNTKLGDLGLGKNWKNIDQEALKKMGWFDDLTVGQEFQDFFAQRVTTYSKGTVDWGSIFEEEGVVSK